MEKPIIKRKDGNISFAVFNNKTEDGKTYYSIVFQRSYKKKGSEEWTNETVKLFPDDLLKISNLATVTYTDIVAEDYKSKGILPYTKPAFEDTVPF